MFRVLVVDDQKHTAYLIATMIARIPGYSADYLTNPQEVMTKLAQSVYDLVLTDYQMPVLNGLELCQKIKERMPKTAVILMTATVEPELEAEIRKFPFVHLLDKMTQFSQIDVALEQALHDQANEL